MERTAARRLAAFLTQHARQSPHVHATVSPVAGTLRSFHQWAEDKQAFGAWLVSTRAEDEPIWVAILEWNPRKQRGNYYAVLFPQNRSGPVAEVHRSTRSEDGEFLHWRYVPRRGDGRNEMRKAAFRRAYGTLEPRLQLPGSAADLDEFIEQLTWLAECRDAATALRDLPANLFPVPPTQSFDRLSKTEKRRVIREVEVRTQQQALRACALEAFGPVCAISGVHCPAVLEAAHIRVYDDFRDNRLGNCLLLRADLHALYDARLLGLHPTAGTVHFATAELRSFYSIEAKHLARWSSGKHKPYASSLRHRWKEFSLLHRGTMVPRPPCVP